MSPENVLRRGYSITTINGKVLQKVEGVNAGDKLVTIISDGEITSVVNNIKKTD
jgi:exodeoxyribonuclease VII large subunit